MASYKTKIARLEALLAAQKEVLEVYAAEVQQVQVLQNMINKHGICTDCGELYEHHYSEPLASCKCHCSEWYDLTPHMKIVQYFMQQQQDVLDAQEQPQ